LADETNLSINNKELKTSTPCKRKRVEKNNDNDTINYENCLDLSIHIPERESALNLNTSEVLTKRYQTKDYNAFLYATCDLNATYKDWFKPKWNKSKEHLCRYNCFIDYRNICVPDNHLYILRGKYNMVQFCFEMGVCLEDCYFLIRLSDEVFNLELKKLTFNEFAAREFQMYCLFEFFTDRNSYDLVKSDNNLTKPFKLFLNILGHIIDCLSISELNSFMYKNYSIDEILTMRSYMSKFMNSRFSTFFKIMLESNIKNWYVYHEFTSFDKNDKKIRMCDFLIDSLIKGPKKFKKKQMTFLQREKLLRILSNSFNINVRNLRSFKNRGIGFIFRKLIFKKDFKNHFRVSKRVDENECSENYDECGCGTGCG
jgi:hypothetical protein